MSAVFRVVSRVADEVANHPGVVWLPIISLKREDAARLGYDDAKSWQTLLATLAPEMAEAMKIPYKQFRWYAAFHDEGNHPHVHMVVYSADGKSGFLTTHGIKEIKRIKNIIIGEAAKLGDVPQEVGAAHVDGGGCADGDTR